MALEELPFENVNRRMDRQMDRLTDGQKVITKAHPEHSSGELKIQQYFNIEIIIPNIALS